MIFISSAWSPNVAVDDHLILDFRKISEEKFREYSEYAHSCMNKRNLAKILDLKYNPEHVQLRPGDSLIAVHIKGGRLQNHDEELPRNVFLEYYCYTVFSPETHVINEKILMEE